MNLPDNCKTVQSTTYRCVVEVRVSEFNRGRGIERIVSQHDGSGVCRAGWIVSAAEEPKAIRQYSEPFAHFAKCQHPNLHITGRGWYACDDCGADINPAKP